jgi:hypothetical protein
VVGGAVVVVVGGGAVVVVVGGAVVVVVAGGDVVVVVVGGTVVVGGGAPCDTTMLTGEFRSTLLPAGGSDEMT